MTKLEKMQREYDRLKRDLARSPSPVNYEGKIVLSRTTPYLLELEKKIRNVKARC